jgi:hypothetical protein
MKQFKRAWHEAMRPRACVLASGRCQRCDKPAQGMDGVIHHLKYPAGCYQQNVEDLMREKICQWLCRSCHEAIHVTDNFEETQDRKKNGAHCKICGKLSFGVWDRARNMGIDYPICKRCLRKQRKQERIDKSGQLKFL